LRNVVERIVVLESDEIVLPEHLPSEILQPRAEGGGKGPAGFTIPDTGLSLEEVEKGLILQALEKAKQNKTLAAKLLGISYDSSGTRSRSSGWSRPRCGSIIPGVALVAEGLW